jgi:hypothetical protein
MNMMRTASAWLDRQRRHFLAQMITYCHFGDDAVKVDIPAVCGRTIFRAENDYGAVIRVQSRDFIVSAEDISFVPQKGDEVICDGRKYEVLAPNDEPVWRWSGNDETALRIHTKEIGVFDQK